MSVKIDCNELIIKNNSLLQTYKNGYSKSVLDDLSVNGWKINLLAPDYKDDFSDDFKKYVNNTQIDMYKSFVQSEFYFHLVKTIIALQKDLYTIFEKSILIEQLNKLIELFFDVLKSETDSYWQQDVDGLIQAQFEGYFSDNVTYPKPKDFTKEYVTSIVSSLLQENNDKENSKDYTKEDWFIVGLKFVDGTVYECKAIKSSGYGLVELTFKEEFLNLMKEEIKILKNRYRNPINGSLDIAGYKDRTLFKKDDKHENQWRLICDYHKKQGGKIDKRFAEQFLKIYSVSVE